MNEAKRNLITLIALDSKVALVGTDLMQGRSHLREATKLLSGIEFNRYETTQKKTEHVTVSFSIQTPKVHVFRRETKPKCAV